MKSDRRRSGMCRKNAEISNANAVEEEEDIFHNKIPEPVITHILSFLPTKDAVRTSVLSKTWEYRWTFLTKLSLDDYPQNDLTMDQFVRLPRTRNFVRFVDRALTFTDGISMDNFSLSLFGRYETSLLDTWFFNIFNRRRVKTLQIYSYFELSMSDLVSHSLFKNSMLVEELELHIFSISIVKVPSMPMTIKEFEILTHSISLYDVPTSAKSISFENLKLLKLYGIEFKNDSPKSPHSILLSFPLLTKIEAENCTWFRNESAVFVIAPLLQSIFIQHNTHMRYEDNFSCISFCDSLHLKEITYLGVLTPQDILIRSSCHASPKFVLHVGDYMIDYNVFKILNQFSHAKSIQFEASKVDLIPGNLCVFSMLTHLEVGLVSVDILLALLQKTPVLKTLVIKGIRKFAEERLSSAVVPECLASLYSVKFKEVNGDNHDLFLAKFFMKNGINLERMCFSLASQIQGKYKAVEKFKKKLYSFRKFDYVVEFKKN